MSTYLFVTYSFSVHCKHPGPPTLAPSCNPPVDSCRISYWEGLRAKEDSASLHEKVVHGLAVGPPPLGYKSEILSGRKGERKVPEPEAMPVLLSLLRDYSTGDNSYR